MNLDVLKNNESVAQFNLGDELTGEADQFFETLIGRGENCYFRLDDRLISREHAKIIFKEGKWFFENLSMTRPALDQGKQKIDKVELKGNEKFFLGDYELVFFMDENTATETVQVPDSAQNEGPDEESQSSEDIVEDDVDNENDENNFAEEENDQAFGESEAVDTEEDYTDQEEFSNEEEFSSGDDEFSTDDEFSADDEFAEGDDQEYAMEESGDKTQIFTGLATFYLEIFGEYAPYEKYTLKEGDNFIGRDKEKCQIYLQDQEVSGQHANIKKLGGKLYLLDKNSANGTLLNGLKVNEEILKDGDEFLIGSTTFTLRVKSDFLKGESDRLLPVEENQVIEVQEVVEVDEIDLSEGAAENEMPEDAQKSIIKKLIWKYKQLPKNKQRIYGAVGILLLYMLLDSEEPAKKVPKKKPGQTVSKDGEVKEGEKVAGKKPLTKAQEKYESLSLEEQQYIDSTYQLGFEFIQQAKYEEALREFDKVQKVIPKFKDTESLVQIASAGFRELEELEKKRLAEIEQKKRQEKINALLEKAKGYVKERSVGPAESTFSQILALDPENLDVPSLRMELDAWKKEKERVAVEKAQKEADRKRKLGQIAPSRTFFGKEEWYKTILKVEEFLKIKDMDEDLVKEATDMLKTSKNNLKKKTSPLIGKARSLKEGQDLKLAYEEYLKVLDFDPINEEALNEMNAIRDTLRARSQKIYREGIIWESLQLWNEAKEKFQEVQQISPKDSEYFIKATVKLKDYLE